MLSLFAYGGHFGRPLLRQLCTQLRDAEERRRRDNLAKFITASCGFPKSGSFPSSSGLVPKGRRAGGPIPGSGFILHHTQDGIFGDDAWFVAEYEETQVIGVADGVGGWRDYGVDASKFPRCLMRQCEKVVKEGRFTPAQPGSILAHGFHDLHETKEPIIGSSTVCIVVLDQTARQMYSANLGDSGCLVVRNNIIVHRTDEQQHFFNTPFQLAMVPQSPEFAEILSDTPDSCDTSSFNLQIGDLVLVATDGLFDNLPDSQLLKELHYLNDKSPDETMLKVAVERLASKARQLAYNPDHPSPFTQRAREHGLSITGGKPDDITVLLSWVAPGSHIVTSTTTAS